MSKESKIKKHLENLNQQSPPPVVQKNKTVKKAPLPVVRPRRKLNRRFIVLLAIWIIAFVVAMLFLSRK